MAMTTPCFSKEYKVILTYKPMYNNVKQDRLKYIFSLSISQCLAKNVKRVKIPNYNMQ